MVGALAGGLTNRDTLLPGLIIGSAWTLAGRRGGLPLSPVSGDRNDGLTTSRRRRSVFYAAIPVWGVVCVLVLLRIPSQVTETAFILVSLLVVVPFGLFVLSECPKCHRHVLVGFGRHHLLVTFGRCMHCGLRFKVTNRAEGA